MRSRAVLVVLALLFAGIVAYRSPRSASSLEVVPDSVEYAVVAQRSATLGRVDIAINGRDWPSRYPPWFSCGVLAPLYRLWPSLPGVGIIAVLFFSLAGIAAAFRIGVLLSGSSWGGLFAASLLAAYKGWLYMARLVMTDVPFAAVALWLCLIYLQIRRQPSMRLYMAAGILAAIGYALRAEGVVLAIPFLVAGWSDGKNRTRRMACVALPIATMFAATAAYNRTVFGSAFRTGYQFWCGVPYDYPAMFFGPRFIGANLHLLAARQSLYAIGIGLAGVILLMRRRTPVHSWTATFALLGVIPAAAAHLMYAYQGWRFFLPLYALLLIAGGAALGRIVDSALGANRRAMMLFGVGACIVGALLRPRQPTSDRYTALREIAQFAPGNAAVISALDPVYLEPWALRGTHRIAVPLSRQVEYASKCVTPVRIAHPFPPPKSLLDARSLLASGALEAIPFTATGSPQKILELLRSGRPVCLEERDAPPDAVSALMHRLTGVTEQPLAPTLAQLELRPAARH
ncbi:MAG: glycosyltransferase family 39 protein [Armatimonadetes bacterium]|nr:glycosyltransferase family 39 protein [Armatimonadota bacterium]MDE2206886.1 glycosyltransferase family 39 protein [Armatimonadota bacterium]